MERRGTGAATLEAKILHLIAGMRQAVLYKILVYLHKAYVTLYRGHNLVIL